ncbi:MAG TPA: hypothetical protein VGQ08_00300 [Nitrospiraceae bacterium]|jgi:hypothetical protein|nr:hypothetical protein [Nitrospiraceae bacterium]
MATLFFPRKRQSIYYRSIIPRRLRPYFKGVSRFGEVSRQMTVTRLH